MAHVGPSGRIPRYRVWRTETRDYVLPVSLSCVVVPLARLEAALDVDELALREELARDLGQAVPRDARVVFGPLVVAAADSFVAIVNVCKFADCT
jgi:hypothetical protein